VTEPAAKARVDGRHNIVVQAIGSGINVAVDARIPHLRLTHFEARTNRARGDSADAALLSAYRTDVVPLLGRDHAIEDLQHWTARDRDVSVRVLTGGAGRGKTRLALELVRKASQDGWLAGFVEQGELDRFRAQQNVADWAWDKPTLIIVDYAASRVEQLREWIGELVDASIETGRPPLRMLLLERQAQRAIGWLASVFGHGQDDRSRAATSMLDPPEPVGLAAIDDIASRRQIFATLLTRKRADLTAPALGADAEFDRLLRDEKWSGDPLFLMMAGLVAGTDGVKNALALTRTDLATTIAQRELDRIGRIAAGARIDAGNRRHSGLLAQHTAVLATLCQGLTLGDARTLIEEESKRLGSAEDVNTTVQALRDGLPGTEDGPEIAPILPDIVGEAAIISWLGSGGVLSGLGIDPLASIHRAAAIALQRTSQVLVRTAQDFAAAGREEPVRWLYAIAQAAEADLGALTVMADALPDQTTALRELALDLTRSIVDRLRIVATDKETAEATRAVFGKSLTNLGNRLFDLGRREEALAASQEAVDITRHLAQTRPDVFLPDLATILNNVAVMLSALGRREEAFAAVREAVDITRRLAETRPDAFLPILAGSLNNLGIRLSDLGRHEPALAASQEAVGLYRRLAHTRPDAFLPDLSMSMTNLGICLSNLGRREQALAARQEATDITRRLAQGRPDAFLPDLAMRLNSLGNGLAALGRREEALAASHEAIDIYRRLAQTRPDAFLPDLAGNLTNLSLRLSDLGRHEEALAASREAVHMHRRLAQTRPNTFLPDLARSLNALVKDLYNLGRHEEALAAGQEAVDIRRGLAQTRPDVFLPDLAPSLSNAGAILAMLGRREEALAASQEAADIYRRLGQNRPDAFLPDLATTLSNAAALLATLGRPEEALAASQEGVDIHRRLARTHPDAFMPDLARSLEARGQAFARAERDLDAAGAFREGLAVIAPFLERHARAFADLARVLRREYAAACKRTGTAPDTALLERVARALGGKAENSGG
jgi:tetratricopeptide (TPR) repeat protein